MRVSETLKAHLAMLVFAFLVSTSFTIGRAITFSLDPVALTFLRFLMAIVIFVVLVSLSKQRLALPSLASWIRYFFLAFLLVVFFVTMFEGLRWTSPLSAGAVFTLVPVMTAVFTFIVFRQKLTAAGHAGLLVASLAAIWIMFDGRMDNLLALRVGRGEAVFLVGCATYAAYAPAVQKLHAGESLVQLTLWTLIAAVVLLLVYGWQPITSTNWHLVSPLVYLAVGWLAIFTTAITFYLIQYAALRLPGTKVMSYTLLIPAFVLVQRVANGGTWPGVSVLAALGVLIVAMAVLQRA